MSKNQIPEHAHTKNLPGVPILPGRNTPFIQSGPPKNVKQSEAPATPTPAPASPQPKSGAVTTLLILFFMLSAFGLHAQTTNNPGVPIFGAGGTSSGLQFVFVNGLGNIAYPPNFFTQNSGNIVTSTGATNSVGTRVSFMSDTTNGMRPIAIIVDGDSESCSVYNGNLTNQTWPYWWMTNTDLGAIATFTNGAISGDFATNVANVFATRDMPQIKAAVAANKTVYWLPYLGQNDLGNAQFPTNPIAIALTNLWFMGRTNGAKVVAFEIPYNYSVSSAVLQNYTNLNNWIAAMSNSWDYLVNPLNVLGQSDTLDNLHYTPAGNQKLAKLVNQTVFGGGVVPSYIPSETIAGNLNVGTINGLAPGLAQTNAPNSWAYDVSGTYSRYGITNLAANTTTPIANSYTAAFLGTNQLAFYVLPVPYGHGFQNTVFTTTFEVPAGVTTTTISSQFTISGKRFNGNSWVADASITPASFNLVASSLVRVSWTNTWANDTDPRDVIFLWNTLPTSYGQNALYIDSLSAHDQ